MEPAMTNSGIKGISWNIDPAGTQHHEIWINPAGTCRVHGR